MVLVRVMRSGIDGRHQTLFFDIVIRDESKISVQSVLVLGRNTELRVPGFWQLRRSLSRLQVIVIKVTRQIGETRQCGPVSIHRQNIVIYFYSERFSMYTHLTTRLPTLVPTPVRRCPP